MFLFWTWIKIFSLLSLLCSAFLWAVAYLKRFSIDLSWDEDRGRLIVCVTALFPKLVRITLWERLRSDRNKLMKMTCCGGLKQKKSMHSAVSGKRLAEMAEELNGSQLRRTPTKSLNQNSLVLIYCCKRERSDICFLWHRKKDQMIQNQSKKRFKSSSGKTLNTDNMSGSV